MKTLMITILLLLAIRGIGLSQEISPVSPLVNDYLVIKDALVKSDAPGARAAAGSFNERLFKTGPGEIPAKNKNTYKSLQASLSAQATAISKETDLAKQRVIFEKLSTNMVSLIKLYPLHGDSLFIDYCPMKNAVWISKNKTIENPYYGNAMLNCGSVKETLN
jgi:hypothetical protein